MQNKLKRFFGFLGLFAALYSSAQTVVIKGQALYYKGEEIAAYSYKDLITYTPVKIGSCQVNDSGLFSITLPGIKTSQYLYLNINNLNGSVYISPGHTYHVIFPPPDTTHYQNPYTTHSIELSFLIKDSDNINNLIIDFNNQFDDFWEHCYLFFLKKEAPPHLDSFYVAMQHRYDSIHNPYFKGYIQYTVAEIGINILEGPKTLGNKYLLNKPILYHNYEYMNFFNDYFNNYVEQYALTKEGKDINGYVNNGDYKGIKDVLKINPLLASNDSLCELVLLKGLYEMYYSGTYKKGNIKIVLHQIATQSHIEEDRIIASDILQSFSKVVSGAESPDFALADTNGVVHSILDFRGRYLYLCFFKSSSEASQSELMVITSLYKKYGKKIYFVCISEDPKLSDLKDFLRQNKAFTWPFLYDDNGKILQKYNVKSLPEFFMIDPKGRFYLSPADSPSHGIELTFNKLLERKKSRER